jgi:hypothetical protein
MLRMIGRADVHLYWRPCYDVDRPDGPCCQERVAKPTPKDRTAAERQKRRRGKQRDDGENDRDMNRVSVTVQEPLRLVAAE